MSSKQKDITNYLTIDSNIFIIASRNTGKSYLARYILKCLFITKQLKYVIVISPTLYNSFQNCIPKNYQYDPKNAEIAINKVLDFQKKHIHENIHAAIIIDDAIGLINFNTPWINNLFTTARHPKITIITISQYVYKLTPTLHANSDYVFILKTKGERSLLGIYKNYFSDWNYQEFLTYIKENTNNYGFILINLQTKSNKNSDIYFIRRVSSHIKDFYLNF